MLRPGKLVTHVISQKPNFGAVLPGGGKVNLVVSRGASARGNLARVRCDASQRPLRRGMKAIVESHGRTARPLRAGTPCEERIR